MRLPNSFGNVSKLPGNRRKPYRARITTGWIELEDGRRKQQYKTIGYYKTKEEGLQALDDYHHGKLHEFKNKPSFIYFISDGDFVKIGKSNNPEERLKYLQTGQPHKLRLVATIPTKDEYTALKIESTLQTMFSDRRVFQRKGKGRQSEWFDISLKEIYSILNLLGDF